METLIFPIDMFLITTVALKKKKVVTSHPTLRGVLCDGVGLA